MSTRFSRHGKTLAATLGVCAFLIAGTALVAIAQQPGDKPAKDQPKTIPATPIEPKPATEPPAMGEAPDGTKMPVIKRFEIPLTIIVEELKIGDGKEAKPGATVSCTYRGTFRNGDEFDSSAKHGGAPIEFSLDGVIEGWGLGIPGMKVGGIRKLTIPYQLAYGRGGRPGIPPKSDLIFSVELKDVK